MQKLKRLKKYQKEILKPLYDLAEIYEVKAFFFPQKGNDLLAWAEGKNNSIHIPVSIKYFNGDIENIYSVFFHELQHIINYREGYFKAYHNPSKSDKNFANLKRTAFRAELFTDRKAEELMKLYFPKLKYVKHYKNNKKMRTTLLAFIDTGDHKLWM